MPAAIRMYFETPPMSKKVAEMMILKTIKTAVNPRIKQKVVMRRTKRLPAAGSFSVVDTATPPAPPRMLR